MTMDAMLATISSMAGEQLCWHDNLLRKKSLI